MSLYPGSAPSKQKQKGEKTLGRFLRSTRLTFTHARITFCLSFFTLVSRPRPLHHSQIPKTKSRPQPQTQTQTQPQTQTQSLPLNAAYHASKAGVLSLWECLGFELDVWHKEAGKKVRNSVICPLKVSLERIKLPRWITAYSLPWNCFYSPFVLFTPSTFPPSPPPAFSGFFLCRTGRVGNDARPDAGYAHAVPQSYIDK